MDGLLPFAALLAAAVVAVPLFKRLGLGSVLGYLAAGIALGPQGLGVVADVDSMMHVSELGVVMLLFLIGLELQPSRLWVLRRSILGLGGAQVALTTVVLGALAQLALGVTPAAGLAVGFALSLSSTAFVLQTLGERRELTHQYGRSSFAILLFQDLAVIPVLAALPLLAGGAGSEGMAPSPVKAAVALVAVVIFGAFLIRPVFRFIAASRTHEVFTAAALLVVIGTALLMHWAGLSMPLGAFLAGVVLANSEYRHELQSDIEPFEGLLLGLFFITVGMAADVSLLGERPLALIAATLVVVVVKAAVLYVIGIASKHGREAAVRLALALPQGGEFAFVLLAVLARAAVVDKALADFMVMVVTMSMAVTPLTFRLADWIGERLRERAKPAFDAIEDEASPVIIAGFGRVGQIVARMLRARRIAFTALEASHTQVDFVRRFGNKLYYGDASRLDLLRAAGAERAKVFVLAVDDVETSMRVAEVVKRHFPHLKLFVRARNRSHAFQLMDLGVDYLMRETFASSVELGAAVLEGLGSSGEQARIVATRFREHDERTLAATYPVYKDEAKFVEATRNYSAMLESLFEGDEAAPRS